MANLMQIKNTERDKYAYKIYREGILDGLNHCEIADLLSKRGVKPPMKAPWSKQSVSCLKKKIERWSGRKRKIIEGLLVVNGFSSLDWSYVYDFVIASIPVGALIKSANLDDDKKLTIVYWHERNEFSFTISLSISVRSLS